MTDSTTSENNGKALHKACRYFTTLAGHEMDGLRPGQIAIGVKVSPATVTRDLRALQDAGFVEQIPTMQDRWRLGPKLIQIALAHTSALDRASSKLAEVTQRYSREPK